MRTCDANNVCSVGTLLAARAAIGADPNLRANGNPFATDAVGDNSGCPAGAYNGRFVLGTAGQVWESCDHGATVNAVNLPGPIGFVNALAYGGMDGATPHGDVLYAGSESGLYVRPAGSATPLSAPRSATYPGGSPVGIVLDPSHWQTAFITDGSQVFSTTDAGVAAANWTNVTGNLFTLGPGRILSITFVPGAAAGLGALLVGTDTGIFASLTTNLGSWAPFSTTLPRTLVSDMRYSSKNGRNVLVVSAFGRGTWKLSSASQAIFGGSQLFGVAPSDQRFAVDLPLTVSNAGVFTVAATQGQFTIAFDANNDGVIEGSEISLPINLGADADTVRSALEAVPAVGAGNIGVTASGNTYTLTLQGTLAAMSYGLLHANLVVSGVVPRTSTAAPISVTTPLAALRTQDGAGANPEIQRIAVAPAAGTFVLSFNGATTQPLLFSASAGQRFGSDRRGRIRRHVQRRGFRRERTVTPDRIGDLRRRPEHAFAGRVHRCDAESGQPGSDRRRPGRHLHHRIARFDRHPRLRQPHRGELPGVRRRRDRGPATQRRHGRRQDADHGQRRAADPAVRVCHPGPRPAGDHLAGDTKRQ